jgi:CMP-N-acetylneuraminic acid synthetase
MPLINTNEIIAVIPARSGSKGVKDKNIIEINSVPLFALSIAAAKSAGIKRVIVSTDSKDYAKLAIRYGAEVPFLRPFHLSDDISTDYDFMHHAMLWIKEHEKSVPEYWVHLRPTSPFRDPEVLIGAIKILATSNANSLRSAHKAPESPHKWFLKDSNNLFIPFKTSLSAEELNSPRQQFDSVFIPNGYVDIVKSSFVFQEEILHDKNMLVYETPQIIEIDTEFELETIHAISKYNEPYIIKYAKKIDSLKK